MSKSEVYEAYEVKKEDARVFLTVEKIISSFGHDAFKRYLDNFKTLKIKREFRNNCMFPAGYDPAENILTIRGNYEYITHELFHVAMDDRSTEYDEFFKKNTGFVEGFTEYFARLSKDYRYSSTAYPIPTLMAKCLIFIYGYDNFDFLFKENNYDKLFSLAKDEDKLADVIDSVNLYTQLSLSLSGYRLTNEINNHINGIIGYTFNSLFSLGEVELNQEKQKEYLKMIQNTIKGNDFKLMDKKNYRFVKDTLSNKMKKR